MFNDPESGYAIFKIKREEDNQPIVAKGHVPNPITGARIVYEGRWDRDVKRNTPFFNISQAKVDYAAGGKTAIRELLVSDFMPGIGPTMADKIVNHRSEEKERMYGPFSESMERAAAIYNAASPKNEQISVEGMYRAMIALKLSREAYSHREDNLLDAAAYVGALNNYIESKTDKEINNV